MYTDSKRLAYAYTKLDATDKAEVRKFIEDYEKKGTVLEQKEFSKALNLGPISGINCPCCGK